MQLECILLLHQNSAGRVPAQPGCRVLHCCEGSQPQLLVQPATEQQLPPGLGQERARDAPSLRTNTTQWIPMWKYVFCFALKAHQCPLPWLDCLCISCFVLVFDCHPPGYSYEISQLSLISVAFFVGSWSLVIFH